MQLQKDNEVRERMKLETELRELRAQLAAAKDEAREAQEAQREAKRPRTEGRKRERSPGNDARRGSLLGGLFGAGWGSGAPTAAAPEPAEDGPDEAEADSEDAETEGDGPEGDSAALRGTDPESLTIRTSRTCSCGPGSCRSSPRATARSGRSRSGLPSSAAGPPGLEGARQQRLAGRES